MSFRTLSTVTLAASCCAVIASIVLFIKPGPRFSIEFTGGTLMEITLPEGKSRADVQKSVERFSAKASESLGHVTISAVKTATEEAMLLRTRPMSNEEHIALLEQLKADIGNVRELQYTTIGPSLSDSLKWKSLQALTIASLAVIAYLAFAFRKLPRKLNPWKFGILAVIGFIHDVIVVTGIFTVIGMFTSFEFDPLFVTALLTILAYSANDTIVIFDRIRANLTRENRHEDFTTVVAKALQQCVTRTFNTTTSTLITLGCLFFFGAESIRWFILTLIVGTIIGAYSSYFVAAPLLVLWRDGKRS
jgi:preprotein translocase subunit SecF